MPIKRRGDPAKLFDRLKDRIAVRAPDALLRAALVLEGNLKQILLTPGKGRIYKRGKNITHQASAPGDPPAPDIGTLQRSITHEVGSSSIGGRGRLGSGIARTVRVGSPLTYAWPLEFGTTKAGKNHNVVILPRPFMRPALAASRPDMKGAMIAGLRGGAGGLTVDLEKSE